MMSPSSTLANRSFLYGGGGDSSSSSSTATGNRHQRQQSPPISSASCLISEKIVYATLDSLALRRATLPLRLLPVEIADGVEDTLEDEEEEEEEEEEGEDEKQKKKKKKKKTGRRSLELDERGRSSSVLKAKPAASSKSIPDVASTHENQHKPSTPAPVRPVKPTSLAINVTTLIQPQNGPTKPELEHRHLQAFDNESDSGSSNYNKSSSSNNSIYGSYVSPKYTHPQQISTKKPKPQQSQQKDKSDKKERREFTFAKNVLHYVPMTSRRYYRKSRKLASKSLSLKSLNHATSKSRFDESFLNSRTLKSRSLSRDELKFVTISQPSNFVHVASATRSSLMPESTLDLSEREVTEKRTPRLHIRHVGKYADLRGGEYSEIANVKGEEECGKVGNESFLWRRMPKVKESKDLEVVQGDGEREEDDYDDVGPPSMQPDVTETHEPTTYGKNQPHRSITTGSNSDPEQDAYDDVGPPVLSTCTTSCPPSPEPRPQPQEAGKIPSEEQQSAYDEQVYDDVMPLRRSDSTTTYDQIPLDDPDETEPVAGEKPTGQLEEPAKPSVDEEQPDEDVYDDVGLPVQMQMRTQTTSQESHERVNSLYAGSSLAGSIQAAYNCYDKESEWEDLDDKEIYGIESGQKIGSEQRHSGATSPSKKKLPGQPQQRWSRKVRRQRSKASRKSSGRSVSRTRAKSASNDPSETTTTTATAKRCDNSYVAVSLGAGSVLLLGPVDEDEDDEPAKQLRSRRQRRQEQEQQREDGEETKGLVQLRVLLDQEEYGVQELSLYIEDSSDDSNYETLQSYEPDDFSSDSEAETSAPAPVLPNPSLHLSLQEPPSRPIPPPPREASLLGHTLGRRMKMLRRTWSITKGSLGRMRRRASGDQCEAQENSNGGLAGNGNGNGDNRKYFSFKKHFRKSQATGLSTFYLDKAAGIGGLGTGEKEGGEEKPREEPIYSNGNWYREAGLYREELDQSMKVDDAAIDHYSVLAEEPLYQFYAAAATRVAFESDSDGYEEVEELTPSSATTDLAKPGHRTLWCQTPQVINSGLLQSLSMEERKIQEAKFEILTSEASYLNSLRVLENEFASNQELVHEILTPAERDKLFGSVPDVLVASERFLAELETIWREDPMLTRLPELMLKHGDKSCNVYVDYCSNQVSIDTTLKELRAKKGYKFLETVSRIELHPACQSLSLHSFLMLPMQRITRLPLLADAVLSKLSVEHGERLSWERVLAGLSHIVGRCNEGARLAERRNEMDALARKLEYSAKVPPITLRDRELIRSGTVIQLSTKSDNEYKLTFGKKFHKTPLMLMLLTDYLLVTKLKSNSNDETYSVIESCKRSLVALESAPEDSPFAGRHAVVLTLLENHAGRQVEYVLTCENDTEKERWLDAVSPPKPTCVGETLYESWDCPQVMALYSYAPSQPDELALQPGDVINVLRKMNDGWLFGEKLLDGEQGWFPGNFTKEVASEHVRARNLRQRHRFLALSGSVLQRRAKQSLSLL